MTRQHCLRILGGIFILSQLLGCTQELNDCSGPQLNLDRVNSLRRSLRSSGPQANLIVPNPLDVTNSLNSFASNPQLRDFTSLFSLSNLLNTSRLENSFIRVRRTDINDAATIFNGFDHPIDSVEYAETMGYYSTNAILNYVEALGFNIFKSRPLFVLVRAPELFEGEVNAFLEYGYLKGPGAPIEMKMIGATEFAPAIDRDMFWHEFGHVLNESASFERGFDFAGDSGAVYTLAAAIHECLADYIAQSVGNMSFIGRWIARNFEDIPDGEPLRSAIDDPNDPFDFSTAAINDNRPFSNPERYVVAEGCTRVLWDLRQQLLKENPEMGSIFSDLLVFSAVGMFGQDASLNDLYDNLLQADEELYCGLHQRSIKSAFESRGFERNPDELGEPLVVQQAPFGLSFFEDDQGEVSSQVVPIGPGVIAAFQFLVHNPNNEVARDVRVLVSSQDRGWIQDRYMQSLGDLAPGQTVIVGLDQGLPALDYAVSGLIDQQSPGVGIRYQFSVIPENGESTVQEGALR